MEQGQDKFKVPVDRFEVLKDDSLMPYGQHKGKRMIDVPAKDLLWLWDNDKCSKSVRAYITDNWDVLCKQAGRKSDRGVFAERVVRQADHDRKEWGIDNPRNAREYRERSVRPNNRKLG